VRAARAPQRHTIVRFASCEVPNRVAVLLTPRAFTSKAQGRAAHPGLRSPPNPPNPQRGFYTPPAIPATIRRDTDSHNPSPICPGSFRFHVVSPRTVVATNVWHPFRVRGFSLLRPPRVRCATLAMGLNRFAVCRARGSGTTTAYDRSFRLVRGSQPSRGFANAEGVQFQSPGSRSAPWVAVAAKSPQPPTGFLHATADSSHHSPRYRFTQSVPDLPWLVPISRCLFRAPLWRQTYGTLSGAGILSASPTQGALRDPGLWG